MKLPEFLSSTPAGVSRASAPAEDGVVPADPATILDVALDIGVELLKCGGEIHRVEDTVIRVCRAYGATQVDVFAITSLITAEVRMPDGSSATHSRRVSGVYNHLARLEACNALSRAVCQKPVSAHEVSVRLEEIRHYRPVPEWMSYPAAMLATGGFTVFFGGTLWDGLAAALIGLLMTLFSRLRPVRINKLMRSLISSFAAGIFAVLCVAVGFGSQTDKIIIGTIMLEIPGIAFGNALRDLLGGDTIAGSLRFIQALLQALVIAMGYMAALVLCGQIGGAV